MKLKLHLMNDRKVIATEEVQGHTNVPFRKLMDALIADLDANYISEQGDVDKLAVSVMKASALSAKRNPPAREQISEFYTGDPAASQHLYSVVTHGYDD